MVINISEVSLKATANLEKEEEQNVIIDEKKIAQ